MKTVGIIAEYNPLHNGHLHHLEEARRLACADYAVVVLGGSFTQRGEPALLSKYTRCEMALRAGADLVLELPIAFSCSSAGGFAAGAVSILDGMGIDALCFGSECGSIEPLLSVADLLAAEPDNFKQELEKNLRKGLSYPAAQAAALRPYLPEAKNLLNSPNNTLGIEYCKALLLRNSSMEILTLPRKGAGYSEETLPIDGYASALTLRRQLLDGRPLKELASYMPSDSLSLLMRDFKAGAYVTADDFSSMLFYRLLSLKEEGYEAFTDVSPAISDKILRHLTDFTTVSDFCRLLSSRDLVYTRLSRSLLHILLDLRGKQPMEAPYARLLGFRESASPLFAKLSSHSLPLLSKLADAKKLLPAEALPFLEQDLFASHLYEGVMAQKTGSPMVHEYRRHIAILPE